MQQTDDQIDDQMPEKDMPPHLREAIKQLQQDGAIFGFDPRILEAAAQRTRDNGNVIIDPDDDTLVGQMVKTPEEEAADKAMDMADDDDDDDDDDPAKAQEQERLREIERYRMHMRVEAAARRVMANPDAKKDKDETPADHLLTRSFREELRQEKKHSKSAGHGAEVTTAA